MFIIYTTSYYSDFCRDELHSMLLGCHPGVLLLTSGWVAGIIVVIVWIILVILKPDRDVEK